MVRSNSLWMQSPPWSSERSSRSLRHTPARKVTHTVITVPAYFNDASLLKIDKCVFDVLANAGDTHLRGEDLINHFILVFQPQAQGPLLYIERRQGARPPERPPAAPPIHLSQKRPRRVTTALGDVYNDVSPTSRHTARSFPNGALFPAYAFGLNCSTS